MCSSTTNPNFYKSIKIKKIITLDYVSNEINRNHFDIFTKPIQVVKMNCYCYSIISLINLFVSRHLEVVIWSCLSISGDVNGKSAPFHSHFRTRNSTHKLTF